MNDTGLGCFVPGRERFIKKALGGLGILGRDRSFNFAGDRSDGTANLLVMFGMLFRLPMRFERRCVTTCL